MAYRTKILGILSTIHLILGVFSFVLGIVAIKVAPFYHGVFGMGIWLGGWMLVTGVSGLLTAHAPTNFCKLGGFIGCCLVGMVTMLVCSIILGVGVLKHFQFEASVTKEYYKWYGATRYTHKLYYQSQEYFDERNRKGRIGCGIYGALLGTILLDIVISLVCCFVCKDILKKSQENITAPHRRRPRPTGQASVIRGVAISNHRQPYPAGIQSCNYWQDGLPVTPKLPSYGELYPEDLTLPAVQVNIENSSVQTYAPPPYTP